MHEASFHVFHELEASGENLEKIQNMNKNISRLLHNVYRTEPQQPEINPRE